LGSNVNCPTTQQNVFGQDLKLESSIQRQEHLSTDYEVICLLVTERDRKLPKLLDGLKFTRSLLKIIHLLSSQNAQD